MFKPNWLRPVKIMSLSQNIWERPLIRKMRRWQDTIVRIEHEMRNAWEREGDGHTKNTYDEVFMLTEKLSKAHQERYRLMKQINKGRQ